MTPLIPRQAVPAFDIHTLNGDWSLNDEKRHPFTMIVVYRGLHCPLCKTYLRELSNMLEAFENRNIRVLAISSDSKERAEIAQAEWKLQNLTLGYGLTSDQAKLWGLYRSRGRGKTAAGLEEPAIFAEPGLLIIKADGTLYWSQISTMPFARPPFKEVLSALDFVQEKSYPARGEIA